jgi:hypothetical protein
MTRRITKKKRISRVKTRGRVKSRGRGRGRGRAGNYTMRGGLGDNDGAHINNNVTYRFSEQDHVDEFSMFVFGTPLQKAAWTTLLETCLAKQVPVYILTSGNRVAIIRTLQLLMMDHYFKEVLCINRNLTINPSNKRGQHNFGGYSKYAVIREIHLELLSKNRRITTGCLFDDDIRNSIAKSEFPEINDVEFLHTKSDARPSDYNEATLRANKFYQLYSKYNDTIINFTPIEQIKYATDKVSSEEYNTVFIDFDETFEITQGPFELQDNSRTNMVEKFREYVYPITIT